MHMCSLCSSLTLSLEAGRCSLPINACLILWDAAYEMGHNGEMWLSSGNCGDAGDGRTLPCLLPPPPYLQQRPRPNQKRGPSPPISPSGEEISSVVSYYRECQKNHAASIGGNALDGCGEFMPGGEEGTVEALKCSACNCHRNFHRREEVVVHRSPLFLGCSPLFLSPPTGLLTAAPNKPNKPEEDVGVSDNHVEKVNKVTLVEEEQEQNEMKKTKTRRHRTKFTAQQKRKMLAFAEKVEWRMQKVDEFMVEQFCRELGIERRVLKVWMHNHKHTSPNKS